MIQKTKFGNNEVLYLSKILDNIKPKNILLVIGRKSFIDSGINSIIEKILKNHTYKTFKNEMSYDNMDNIIDGINFINHNNFDFIIAIGGGSVIDKAKIINILTPGNNNLINAIKKKDFRKNKIPLIAIPTTSGTGSESTKFATLYNKKIKYSIEHKSLIPEYAIIDPMLTQSNSIQTIISSGLDALSQSIESYWSVGANKESKEYASEAMEIAWNILPKFANSEATNHDWEMISWAAHLSGKAINISKTTACHAISYYLTANYGISHGHAVALTLGPVFKYNLETTDNVLNDRRGRAYCINCLNEICAILNIKNLNKIKKYFDDFLIELNLKKNLTDFNVKKSDLNTIVNNINIDRMNNNPRSFTKKDIFNILESIY